MLHSAKNAEKNGDGHANLAHSFLVKYRHRKCRILPKMKKKMGTVTKSDKIQGGVMRAMQPKQKQKHG